MKSGHPVKRVQISPKQAELRDLIYNPDAWYVMAAGGANSGKTFGLILFLLELCHVYPGSRWAIVRKNLTVARRTVLRTFQRVSELVGYEYTLNKSTLEVRFANGSELLFLEADKSKDPDFNKFKSLEITGAYLNESNELEPEAFEIIKTRIGRWVKNGCQPKILLDCNPAANWVKRTFKYPYDNGLLPPHFSFIEMNPLDNIAITDTEIEILDSLPDKERSRFFLGLWDVSDDPNQLIKYEWIKRCINEDIQIEERDTKKMGVDVARYGDDKTVMVTASGNKVFKILEFVKQDTTKTADRVEIEMSTEEIGYENVKIDINGLGAGVADPLMNRNKPVIPVDSASKPYGMHPLFQFRNTRAEMMWNLREKFKNTEIEIPNHQTLIDDLLSLRYFVKDKVLQMESKDEMKKRIGRSPDYADALGLCFYEVYGDESGIYTEDDVGSFYNIQF